jgi:hypothetical protein
LGPILLLVVLGLAAVLVAGGPRRDGTPLDPASTGPLGAKGLVELLGDQGATVAVTDQVPGSTAAVALVLEDQLGDRQREELARWVGRGGTLVVADPGSPLAGVAGFTRAAGGRLARRCDLPVFAETREISVAGGGLFKVPLEARGCFGTGDGSFVVVRPQDGGIVVALGNPSPFLNNQLGSADNSVLAVSLLAPRPGATVTFLRPPAIGGGRRSLKDLISPRLKLALVQLLIAFVLVCLWRGRRLGRPVLEPQPVQLAGSELVVAVGNLLQQARRRQQAAGMLQEELRRTLGERLALGRHAPAELVATVAAERTGIDKARILAALTAGPPDSEAALVALAQNTEAVRQEVVNAR